MREHHLFTQNYIHVIKKQTLYFICLYKSQQAGNGMENILLLFCLLRAKRFFNLISIDFSLTLLGVKDPHSKISSCGMCAVCNRKLKNKPPKRFSKSQLMHPNLRPSQKQQNRNCKRNSTSGTPVHYIVIATGAALI